MAKSKKNSWSNLEYDFLNKKIIATKKVKEENTNTQKKWIIYARVSTEEQRDKWNGINWQIIDCENRAKYNNTEIVKIFKDEAISWTNLNRKEFVEALEYVEEVNKYKHEIDFFICSSTSRFSRNKDIWKNIELIWRLNNVWVQLVAVWNWWIQELESETWYLQFGMQSLMDALEAMRWWTRVRYWIKWKLSEWYRPFSWVPAWYKRIVQRIGWREIKLLVPDEVMFPILKEWLEQFALWKLTTKMELFEFLEERWFRSNSKVNKTGKFYIWDIDKLLTIEKLIFYVWKIYSPKYLDEPVEWKHQPLIDYDIFDKLMRKLHNKWVDYKKRKYDTNSEEYPLTRILLCPECHKWMTKWKSKSHTWDYHHYYWCNTKWCISYRISLPRETVHEAIKNRLNEIALSSDLRPYFDEIFKDEIKARQWDVKKINDTKKLEIQACEKEMRKIEKLLDKVTNEELFEKKQNQWAELNEKRIQLEYSMEDTNFDNSELMKAYNDAKVALFNPGLLWEIWDAEMKQLLIRVCFWGKIYYSKKQGCQTPEISSIYLYFKGLKDPKLSVPGGAESRTQV